MTTHMPRFWSKIASRAALGLFAAVDSIDHIIGVPFAEKSSRVLQLLNWHGRRLVASILIPLLGLRNTLCTETVLGDGPPVSLTSYGHRTAHTWATLESIGMGYVRPSQLVLWLDSEADVEGLGARHQRLIRRGLTVRLTKNLGPHTKYFPFVQDIWDGKSSLATADDDVLYPPSWLKMLVTGQRLQPKTVQAHRAHLLQLKHNGRFEPYASWPAVRFESAHPRVFPTGVSGVLYTPGLLAQVKERGEIFVSTTPRNDDVWLHSVAADTHVCARQLRRTPRHFPEIPGSQTVSLQAVNVGQSANDPQIEATYTDGARSHLMSR